MFHLLRGRHDLRFPWFFSLLIINLKIVEYSPPSLVREITVNQTIHKNCKIVTEEVYGVIRVKSIREDSSCVIIC
jgi:hypothetical protein